MFNTFNRVDKSVHNYSPSRIDVHEHKAPTDESVKLLNEFEEKAKENIIAVYRIEENNINAVAILYQDNVCQDAINYFLKFNLNGREYKLRGELKKRDIKIIDFHAIDLSLYKILREAFCNKLIDEIFKQIPDTLNTFTKISF